MEMRAKQYFIKMIKAQEVHWSNCVSFAYLFDFSCWKSDYTLIIHACRITGADRDLVRMCGRPLAATNTIISSPYKGVACD